MSIGYGTSADNSSTAANEQLVNLLYL